LKVIGGAGASAFNLHHRAPLEERGGGHGCHQTLVTADLRVMRKK
jgi:hypothetical protein